MKKKDFKRMGPRELRFSGSRAKCVALKVYVKLFPFDGRFGSFIMKYLTGKIIEFFPQQNI